MLKYVIFFELLIYNKYNENSKEKRVTFQTTSQNIIHYLLILKQKCPYNSFLYIASYKKITYFRRKIDIKTE